MLTAHLYLVVESTHHIEKLCAVLVALWFGQRRRRYLLVGVGSALDVEARLEIRASNRLRSGRSCGTSAAFPTSVT